MIMATVGGCTTQHTKPQTKTFQKAEAIGDSLFPSEFKFSTSKYMYSLKSDGQGFRKVKGSDSIAFVLAQESQDMFSLVFFLDEGEDLILLYTIQNDSLDGAWGEVLKLNQNSLKIQWRQNASAFCIGAPLVEGSDVYLTGTGYVAKLALSSGKIIWQHDSLYDQQGGHFISFESPKIMGDTVLFLENPDQVTETKTIRVHSVTGKILSIQ